MKHQRETPPLGAVGLSENRPWNGDEPRDKPKPATRQVQRYEIVLGWPSLLWDNQFRCWKARDINGDPMATGFGSNPREPGR